MDLWFEAALLPSGWCDRVRISTEGGVITAVAPDEAPRPTDQRHGIALPGMTNLHSHAFQRGMAGLAETRGPDGDSFWTWREIMYRFLDRLTPDDVEAIAALAYAEMLETGFTEVAEFHYLHHDPAGRPYANIAEMAERIAAAGAETGIAVAMLPSFYAHGGIGGAPPVAGQRRFLCDLDRYAKLLEASEKVAWAPGSRVAGVAPHSLRAVAPDELRHVITLAGGRPVHIHVSEQPKEVDDCLAWSGKRPVEWLLDEVGVGPQWCLIHATHTNSSELARAADLGVIMGLCPVTEANLGDGIFKTADWVRFGERGGGALGVGTDSNVLIGVAAELRQLEYAQRLATGERNAIAFNEGHSSGELLFVTALAGGARAVGRAGEDASLGVGSPADIVALDPDHVSLVARSAEDLIDGWVFAATQSPVTHVWARGHAVVTGGRHVHHERISRRYRDVIRRIMA